MITNSVYIVEKQGVTIPSARDIVQLVKMRLTSVVVFSAAMGYILGAGNSFSWLTFCALIAGGFLITGSSNGFNQVIEKDTDKLMTRTANRPVPDGRMSVGMGYVVSALMGVAGITVMAVFVNPLTAILGLISLLLYVVVYTPMKKVTPFAVFLGAIPGALPPVLGWVAATGSVGHGAIVLFAIQFMWQFPHFWAIAWVLNDEYNKAGFYLLPSAGGRDRKSAFRILTYTAWLIPVSLLPVWFNLADFWSASIIVAVGIMFLLQAIQLYRTNSMKAASRLMFGSFIYLPAVLIALVTDKF